MPGKINNKPNIVQRLFSLHKHTDAQGVINEISSNISISGFNAWMLICSALIASIGLDLNSSAVIIGAMLISPLMSPILGVGLAVGIYDKEMLLNSLKHWAFAIILSIATSFLYFLITPLGEISGEIIARTQPTLLDVAVAFFGGVAGIVAGSRDEKTNVVPGAAIATALMPPLCVVGFGLAKGQWLIFSGSFYLFFLNAVFISFSTILMVKYLHFPRKKYVDDRGRKRINRIMAIALILITLPSIYFLYTVYRNVRNKSIIQNYVVNDIKNKGNEIIKWNLITTDSTNIVKVYISGAELPKSIEDSLGNVLAGQGLHHFKVKLFRINITKEEILQMNEENRNQLVKTLALESKLQQLADSLNQWKLPKLLELQKEIYSLDSQWSIRQYGKVVFVDSTGRQDTIFQVSMLYKPLPLPPQPPVKKKNKKNQQPQPVIPQQPDSAKQVLFYNYLKARLRTDTLSLRINDK